MSVRLRARVRTSIPALLCTLMFSFVFLGAHALMEGDQMLLGMTSTYRLEWWPEAINFDERNQWPPTFSADFSIFSCELGHGVHGSTRLVQRHTLGQLHSQRLALVLAKIPVLVRVHIVEDRPVLIDAKCMMVAPQSGRLGQEDGEEVCRTGQRQTTHQLLFVIRKTTSNKNGNTLSEHQIVA